MLHSMMPCTSSSASENLYSNQLSISEAEDPSSGRKRWRCDRPKVVLLPNPNLCLSLSRTYFINRKSHKVSSIEISLNP